MGINQEMNNERQKNHISENQSIYHPFYHKITCIF